MGLGRSGHEIIAKAAQSQLNDSTVSALNDLRRQQINLADLNTGEKPPYDYIDKNIPIFFNDTNLDLSLIANWPDGWRYPHKETYNWHFIDLDITKDVTKADEDSYCHQNGDKDCNVEQIPAQLNILGDSSQPTLDRAKALFFVVHFVGDLHQPLHCANDNDKGGNDNQVTFFNQSANLHHIWDDNILSQQGKSEQDIIDGFSITDDQKKSWSQGDTGDWALESYQIAKTKIYPAYPSDGSTPSYGTDYENQMWPIVQEQLEKASVRLAYLLNTTLGGGAASSTPSVKPNKTVVLAPTPSENSSSSGQVVVIKASAKVYSEASSKSALVKRVSQGDVLDLIDSQKEGNYYKVTVDGQVGCIYYKNVELKQGGSSSSTDTSSSTSSIVTSEVTPSSNTTSVSTGTTTTAEVISVPEPYDGCSKGGDADSHPAADGDLNKLKNRDYNDISGGYEDLAFADVFALPTSSVNKTKMVAWPSDDLGKIQPQEKRAVSIQGYLLLARKEGAESCNCHSTQSQDEDFHVWLSDQPGDGSSAPDRSHAMVVEVSPRIRSVYSGWQLQTLLGFAKNQTPVKVSGLLMYDDEHPEQIGKTRGTLWEIHPITKIEYKQSDNWVELK